jgi:hypothetical protein
MQVQYNSYSPSKMFLFVILAKGQRKVGIECADGNIVNFTFSYSSDNNNGTSVEDGQIPEIIFHT